MEATHLREFIDGPSDDHLEHLNAELEASGRQCSDLFVQEFPEVSSQAIDAVHLILHEISRGLEREYSVANCPDRNPETLMIARTASERVVTNAFLRRLNSLYEAAALKGGTA